MGGGVDIPLPHASAINNTSTTDRNTLDVFFKFLNECKLDSNLLKFVVIKN